MSARRSTTGCAACKRKRRKCDEGKPHCRRCLSSGEPCNYEYVEHPTTVRHLIQRTKPAPRPPPEPLDATSRDTSTHLELATIPFSVMLDSDNSTATGCIPTATGNNSAGYDFDFMMSPGIIVDAQAPFALSPLSDPYINSTTLSHIPSSFTQPTIEMSDAMVSPPCGPEIEGLSQLDHDEIEFVEDDDAEGIRVLLCVAPIMDKNVKDNSLPFVLQCYSQWAIISVFEPLKIVHAMREQIIEHFSYEDVRTRTILVANVMNMFAKNPSISATGKSIVAYLSSSVRECVRSFMATPPSSVPALDRQRAMRTLDSTLEIMTLQINTQPLSACIQSAEEAAPVFRRACSEPPGQPLDLANILLEPALNLRHFVSIDIMGSVTSGRPTFFQYQVNFSAELCDRMLQLQADYGLQWLHGLPDQFIMIFAWINSLCEVPGASVDMELISRVETEILQAKIAVDQSEDPALRIGRTVVREGWRNAVLIYLYMVLCKEDASDLRVVRALGNFMRLVRGIKAGRNPDTYLANPMIIAGVAACKARDRNTIRERILGVPECSTPDTAGYDVVLGLEDVWKRTKNEGRAAVWADLGIARFRVAGK